MILNPRAKFDRKSTGGYLYDKFNSIIGGMSLDCIGSRNTFKKHVLLRLTYLCSIVTAVVTRIADFVAGVFAAIGAIVTLGKLESLNTFAYRSLALSGLIGDVAYSLQKLINPWS